MKKLRSMKKWSKRGLALFLVFAMCIGTMPITAFASEEGMGDEAAATISESVENSGSSETFDVYEDRDSDESQDTEVTATITEVSEDSGTLSEDNSDESKDLQTDATDPEPPDNVETPEESNPNEGQDVEVSVVIPETPEIPDTAETPEPPEETKDSETTEAPDVPAGSDTTEEPDDTDNSGTAETPDTTETPEPPIAEGEATVTVDKDAILNDIKDELTPGEDEGYIYDETTLTYTKTDNNTSTIVQVTPGEDNSYTRTETTTKTEIEQVTLEEGKEWDIPEGAVQDDNGGFSYTATGENGAKTIKTVTKNEDGSYTVKTETITIETTVKKLVTAEDGTVTLEAYKATSGENNGKLTEVETTEIEPEVTVDYTDLFSSSNDLYDREGFKATKTVIMTSNGIAVRGSDLKNDLTTSGNQLKAGTVVYVYETKPDSRGVEWYRIGKDAWITSEYSMEIRQTGNAGVKYEVQPPSGQNLKICNQYGVPYSNGKVYWVSGDTIEIHEQKVINGELYYKCYYGKNGNKSGWVKASGLEMAEAPATTPDYTDEEMKDLLQDENQEKPWDAAYFGEVALESAIRVPCNNYNNGTAEIRILRGENGKTYYVYCAEHGQADRDGYRYELLDLKEDNLASTAAKMNISEDDLKHVMAIAANGYWGVKNETQADQNAEKAPAAVGSLDALKEKILADLEKDKTANEEMINALKNGGLTDGIALAATQGAIWYYTSNGDLKTIGDDFEKWIEYLGKYFNTEQDPITGKAPMKMIDTYKTLLEQGKTDQIKALQAAYEWLVNAGGTSTMAPEAITENNYLKDVSITVKEIKVEKQEVSADTTNKELQQAAKELSEETTANDSYNTDVSFTMAVIPSMNDDLLITIYADGKPVKTVRLAGESKETDKERDKFDINGLTDNGNGNYTIKNVTLPNGAKIDITLAGTQNMGRGVYVFKSEEKDNKTSQTFVGISDKEWQQTVNVNMTLDFNVETPKATVTTMTTSSAAAAINLSSRDIPGETPEERDDPGDPGYFDDPDIPRRSGRTRDSEEPYRAGRTSEGPVTVVFDEAVPLASLPDIQSGVEILDQEIPLSGVPRTGDNSGVWSIFAMLSFCGLAVLNLTGKRKEENA